MAKRGRPPALDDAARRGICLLVLSGHSLASSARCVGCAVNTVRNTAGRDAKFRADLEIARREGSHWRLFHPQHTAMRALRRCAKELARERRLEGHTAPDKRHRVPNSA